MVESLQTARDERQEWGRTLEQKVEERTRELRAMQSGMVQSEKLASIGRLAAGVAHEINNPLGGILSLSMLALEEMGDDHPLRRDVETIVRQTLRCREIVKGLLDFSRQSDHRATHTDVNPVIESTLALLGRQAMFQNIRREVSLRRDLPAVFVDPGQMQAVVMNIAINAADAMDECGTLTVSTELDAAAHEVLVRVGDTGHGIPDDVLPLIFEPFFTTKKVGQGTGLGLAIVHGIVTRAGGRIEVRTSPEGTVFTVRLPVAPAAEAADEAVGGGARQSAGG